MALRTALTSILASAVTILSLTHVPSAFGQQPYLVADYQCELIVYRQDHSKGFKTTFLSSFSSGSHGGETREFYKSKDQKEDLITVQASRNWMALNWVQNKKLVAQGIFAHVNTSLESRVVILMNPFNDGEQVSLECSPYYP